MKSTVRDDIIGLETFTQTRFKYEKYIYEIYQCGGYCFLDQLGRHFTDIDGRYLAKKLEENNLVILDSYNNYKIVRLSDTAIKYLTYKDTDKDFSDKKKSEIVVKKLRKNPSHKVLFNSVYKFEITSNGANKKVLKENLLNLYKKIFNIDKLNTRITHIQEGIHKIQCHKSSLNSFFRNYMSDIDILVKSITSKTSELQKTKEEIKKIEEKLNEGLNLFNSKKQEKQKLEDLKIKKIRLETEINLFNTLELNINKINKELTRSNKNQNEYEVVLNQKRKELKIKKQKYNNLKKEVINLYDRSKIIPIVGGEGFKNAIFYVLDLDSSKSKKGYIDLISSFLNVFINTTGVKVSSFSISFITYNKKREKDLIKLKDSIERGLGFVFSNWSNKERLGFDSYGIKILPGKIFLYEDIDKYRKVPSSKVSYIKENDIEPFQQLMDKLNTKTLRD